MSAALKPAQAECKRCERLFCYFRRNVPRIFCTSCVELERLDLLEFSKVQRRKARIMRAYEAARAA